MLTRLALDTDLTTICRAMRATGSHVFTTKREIRAYVRVGGYVAVSHDDQLEIFGAIFYRFMTDDDEIPIIMCDYVMSDSSPQTRQAGVLATSIKQFLRGTLRVSNSLYVRTQCANNSVSLSYMESLGFLPDEEEPVSIEAEAAVASFRRLVFRPTVAHKGALVIERILAGNCAVMGE